jgi:hypothetical protein
VLPPKFAQSNPRSAQRPVLGRKIPISLSPSPSKSAGGLSSSTTDGPKTFISDVSMKDGWP